MKGRKLTVYLAGQGRQRSFTFKDVWEIEKDGNFFVLITRSPGEGNPHSTRSPKSAGEVARFKADGVAAMVWDEEED